MSIWYLEYIQGEVELQIKLVIKYFSKDIMP